MTLLGLWLAVLGAADLVRWEAGAPRGRQLVALSVAGAGALLGAALGGLGPGRTLL